MGHAAVRMARLTQKEMARRLGVSQALVSRALTGTAAAIDASPATVTRICRAAAEWGYRPSAAALTLKGRPTRTLGVVIKAFDDPFLGHVMGELQGLARQQGYTLLLAGWDARDRDEPGMALFDSYQVDGVVIVGSDCRPAGTRAFLGLRRRVVQIGGGPAEAGVDQVRLDERRGLAALVAHVAGLGHRRVAVVAGTAPAQVRRVQVLRQVLGTAGRTVSMHVQVPGERPDVLTAALRGLAVPRRGGRPSVVLAGDDAMAQMVLRDLYDLGLRVPQDVSLAGFDDVPAARAMIPALTTVRQPVPAMVREAFARVTGAVPAGDLVLAPELVIRESCAAPAHVNRQAERRRTHA